MRKLFAEVWSAVRLLPLYYRIAQRGGSVGGASSGQRPRLDSAILTLCGHSFRTVEDPVLRMQGDTIVKLYATTSAMLSLSALCKESEHNANVSPTPEPLDAIVLYPGGICYSARLMMAKITTIAGPEVHVALRPDTGKSWVLQTNAGRAVEA